MSLQENVSARVAYKAYAAGTMTANTEADRSTAPGASSAQVLRRVTSTLNLLKNTYESNEITSHRQVSDMRHGPFRVGGDITAELSPATHWDIFEGVMRATDAAAVTKTESDFTTLAADEGDSSLTVGASTWAAQGYRVGDVVRLSDMSVAANNAVNFQITALNGTVATVYPAPTDNGADAAFTVTRPGRKVFPPASSHVSRLFAFEHYYDTIDVAALFTECRVNRFGLALPASGMATCSLGITGRNMVVLTAGDAPYFTSPTAETETGIAAAVNGTIIFQGTKIGVLTGLDFSCEMQATPPEVVGQNFTPEIFLGRTRVPGNLTALLEDSTFLDAFKNETEVEIIGHLATTSAANSPFISFAMTRCKLGGANVNLEGEAGISIQCPFVALKKATATGYDASSLVLGDSEAT